VNSWEPAGEFEWHRMKIGVLWAVLQAIGISCDNSDLICRGFDMNSKYWILEKWSSSWLAWKKIEAFYPFEMIWTVECAGLSERFRWKEYFSKYDIAIQWWSYGHSAWNSLHIISMWKLTPLYFCYMNAWLAISGGRTVKFHMQCR